MGVGQRVPMGDTQLRPTPHAPPPRPVPNQPLLGLGEQPKGQSPCQPSGPTQLSSPPLPRASQLPPRNESPLDALAAMPPGYWTGKTYAEVTIPLAPYPP